MSQKGTFLRGVIAASDKHTASAGAEIFKAGGNAADALVAAAFAATVCEVLVINIGSGGFATIVDEAQQARVYDFICVMPSGKLRENADFREIFIDFGGEKQPFHIGRASTGIPGLVAGLGHLAKSKGSLPWAQLLAPAINLAESGFVVSEMLAHIIQLLEPTFKDCPKLTKTFKPHGRFPNPGERLFFPELAVSLKRMAAEGPECFYQGTIGQEIATDHQSMGGLLTQKDMDEYVVEEREPIRIQYRSFEILLPPPPSNGGILIAFALKLLASQDLQDIQHNGEAHLEILGHVMQLTSKARQHWDKNHSPGQDPIAHFLDPERLKDYEAQLQEVLKGKGAPFLTDEPKGSPNTTQISTIDVNGLAVSCTISTGVGAGYLIGETGVHLNNFLGESDLNPHGFHADPPGSRVRSMMSPAIVLYQGKPILTVGSAGSNRIRSAITQVISNILDFGMEPQQAISSERAHLEAGLYHLEDGIPLCVAKTLESKGFNVKLWDHKSLYFGGAQAVLHKNGQLLGGADPRRAGSVAQA